MSDHVIHPLVEKLKLLTELEPFEEDFIRGLGQRAVELTKGQSLLFPQEDVVTLVLEGWACRYKILTDGRRQITSFVLPGDLTGVRACLFGVSDFEAEALTDCRVAVIEGKDIAALFSDAPKLAAAITWASAREEAILAEHVVSLGRRTAKERMAHLFLELYSRLESVGSVDRMAYGLPITQEMIADCLGLSIVHVNRTLKSMRQEGLLDYFNGYVILREPKRLKAICGYDDDHLSGTLHPELAELQSEEVLLS